MLEEVLSQEAFELIIPEKETEDYKIIYLMNDAVESFLVLVDSRMTGVYKDDYEGSIDATLVKTETGYALTVRQEESVLTLFFQNILLDVHLYNYGEIAHFWVKDYEYLRHIEFQLAIIRDKAEYLGREYCSDWEMKLAKLAYFPPLNKTCYPAVPAKYISVEGEDWIPEQEAIDVMEELAREVGDFAFVRLLTLYRYCSKRFMTKFLATCFRAKKHFKLIEKIDSLIKEEAKIYPNRSFESKQFQELFMQKWELACMKKKELELKGYQVLLWKEEPFTVARDQVDFQVYLMYGLPGCLANHATIMSIGMRE